MYCISADGKTNEAINLPLTSSLVNFSKFKELERKVPFRRFAIKYVVEGCEKYTINGRKFHLHQGQYLLANQKSEGSICIDSKKLVQGICIDLSTSILTEVVASHIRPDTQMPDNSLDTFFTTDAFLENQYNATTTKTGRLLLNLSNIIANNPYHPHHFSKEFYFNIAEKLVEDHQGIHQQMQAISSIKLATRKELTRRIITGKYYIDTNFKSPLTIEEIARESGLSEYHFHRLFKSSYGISPYQYLLNLRLNFSLESIKKSAASLTDIAYEAGFADIYSFSKAFKKHFGQPPSVIARHLIS
ncbi:MAG: helix-turn-helix domain-containing protein [Saprospiraceae bacterium]|nr:helix-turn-helix domain-containing protein [Saprospiraceae bacterium]